LSTNLDIHQILKSYWGYEAFRLPQQEIIEATLENKDVLALLPTGGGKSICFQVPALAKTGLCIVVSPLIALMKDQVENLRSKGISANAIYSGMSANEIKIIFENCQFGGVKFLYLSPERLSTQLFKDNLHALPVTLLAIDEAHCISQWGHDFRPEYRRLKEVRQLLEGVPVLALTASATPKVIEDIMLQLDFKTPLVFKKSFERTNLHYIVRNVEDKYGKLINAVKKVSESGLIYVRNRKKTEEIADFLIQNGVIASFYHAGLNPEIRSKRQEDWIKNKIQIMVCTNAFGMGIDKPDCKLVIHFEIPDCLEAYYQEAGRAGRNGNLAYCLLFFHESDALQAKAKLAQQFPEVQYLRDIYEQLNHFYQISIDEHITEELNFDLLQFSSAIKQNPVKVAAALKQLSLLEVLHISEGNFEPNKLKLIIPAQEIFNLKATNELWFSIIQVVLRSYGGLFDFPVSVQTNLIAMKCNLSELQLKEALEKMKSNGILEFYPSEGIAKLTFNYERIEKKILPLNTKLLLERKQQEEGKLEAMISFGRDNHICRSRQILTYFGETNIVDCGTCDVCMERKRGLLPNEKFKSIETKLGKLNWNKSYDIKELSNLMGLTAAADLLIVCRYLADKGILLINDKQEISWIKAKA